MSLIDPLYPATASIRRLTTIFSLVAGTMISPVTLHAETSAPALKTFMKDAGWCWYQDPRAVIHHGKLVVAGLSGVRGDVKISVFDLKTDKSLGTSVLHEKFQVDDHNVPALHVRPDGSILAVYAKHSSDRTHHYRISDPDNYLKWGKPMTFVHDYPNAGTVTYTNLYTAEDEGKLYNFFRGIGFNPSFITSRDHGLTWGEPSHLISDEVEGKNRPYPRYVQRDENTVGISFTEAHPRNFGNSIYYADFRAGAFFKADGSKIKDLKDGPLTPKEAELVFKGGGQITKGRKGKSAERSAWTSSIATDSENRPHIGYTLYLTNEDHRYRIAHWDGSTWIDREVAHAGKCLYLNESSYTGLITLDPSDPSRVVIATDVDPTTGKDLGGTHEIYTAKVGPKDDTRTIQWQPVTRDSPHRNIRPVIVAGEGYRVVLWLRGPWRTFTDYESDVVGMVIDRP